MREDGDAGQRQADGERSDRPTRSRGQSAGRGRQRAHVQRMAGRKRILALAGKRNPVEMTDDRRAVRTGLVEEPLHAVGQQRRCGRHKHGVVGGAPHRLASASRGEPADSRQSQEHLFVGAPSQGAGEPLGRGAGLTRNGASDGHVRLGRSDGHRQAPSRQTLAGAVEVWVPSA